MSEKLTHWKKIDNPNYIGSYSLATGEDANGKIIYTDKVVIIVKVGREFVKDTQGKEEEKTVAHLKNEKPLILNSTNQKTISDILGTPFIENWVGQKITLFVQNIKAFGEFTDALRVRPTAPKAQVRTEVLESDVKLWDNIIKALNGGNTMDQVKSKYSVSIEVEAKLNAAVQKLK